MFQLSKKTIIFLVVFSVILLGITIGAIIYTNTHDSQDTSQVIIESKSSSNEVEGEKLVDDGINGINLDDRYNVNDLEVKSINYNSSENSKLAIDYVQIFGLNNESIQDKINNEIKDTVFKMYTDKELKDASIKKITINTFCDANFSDVLSISFSKFIEYGNDTKFSYDGLNYRLDTGDKINFSDLFTYNAAKKNIIAEAAYKQFAWNYEGEGSDGLYNMERINYSELEDDVYNFIYKYSLEENPKFSFSEKQIFLYVNDIRLMIPMYDCYEDIAIYNRFKSEENLYKEDIFELEELPVLMYFYNRNYGVYYEDDNCTIDIKVAMGIEGDMLEECKKVIKERLESIKKEASQSDRGIYYISFLSSFENNDSNNVELQESYVKYSCTKSNYKKYISDVIKKQAMESLDEDPKLTLQFYILDDRYVKADSDYIKLKVFDKETGKEKVEENHEEQPIEENNEIIENNEENDNYNTVGNTVVDDDNINNSTNNNNNTNDVTNGITSGTDTNNTTFDTVVTVD